MGKIRLPIPRRRMWYSTLFLLPAFSVLISYLVSANQGFNLNLLLFWIPIVTIAATILFQIMNLTDEDTSFEKVILFEIFLMTIVFHLISVIPMPMGLRQLDSHYDYYAARAVMEFGWPVPENAHLLLTTKTYLDFPMTQFLAVIASRVGGIDLFIWARWFPSIYSSFALPLFYVFSKNIYRDKRTALLAAFAFSSIWRYIDFDNMMVRESLGFVFLFLVLYTSTKAQITHRIKFLVLGLLSVIALTFTHHLTSFMYMLFVIVLVLLPKLLGLLPQRAKRSLNIFEFKRKTSATTVYFLSFIFVLIIAYWVYVAVNTEVLAKVVTMISSLSPSITSGNVYVYTSVPLQAEISIYGNLMFSLVAGILVLTHIFRKKCNYRLEDLIFSIWVIFLFLIVYLFAASEQLASQLNLTRLQVFLFPFFILVAAHVIVKNKMKPVLSLLFLIFVVLQIFTIPINAYNHSIPPEYDYNRVRSYYLPQEYSAVYWFNSSGKVIGDRTVREILGGLRQVEVTVPSDVSEIDVAFPKGSYIFYRMEDSFCFPVGASWASENFSKLTSAEFDKTRNKFYDNAEVMIYG